MSYDIQRCVRNIELTDREIYLISLDIESQIKEYKFLIAHVKSSKEMASAMIEEYETILEKFK